MRFREWINTEIDSSDIWTRCIDPTGEDKDNIIYASWDKVQSQRTTASLTNYP